MLQEAVEEAIGIVSWIASLFRMISATLSWETMFGIEFNMVHQLVNFLELAQTLAYSTQPEEMEVES